MSVALPTLLAIDTAGPRLQLGLLGQDSADSLVEEIGTGHAEILFNRIATLLSRNGVGLGEIARLAVTTGPGSFTGLRIGISAARGLALPRRLPVLGVPTLMAISLGVADSGRFAISLDARRNEAYLQRFLGPARPDGEVGLVALDAVPKDALALTHPDIILLGRFAQTADPARYPPNPLYVRAADAKPQTNRVALQ